MRAAFIPLFLVAGQPQGPYVDSLTRGYTPIWPVPCTFDEIANWCFRVKSWRATITSPPPDSAQVVIEFPAQFQDERDACLPVSVTTVEVQPQITVDYLVGGFGASYTNGDADNPLAINIGPSAVEYGLPLATEPLASDGSLITGGLRILSDPVLGKFFPLLIGYAPSGRGTSPDGDPAPYALLSSYGTEDKSRVPLLFNWTPSVATVTFCGHPVGMFWEMKPHLSDWPGSIVIEPASGNPAGYFPYAKQDGTEPIYDPATGAAQISPVPLYPPR